MNCVDLCDLASSNKPFNWPDILLDHYIYDKDMDIFGERRYLALEVLNKGNYSLIDALLLIFNQELEDSNTRARHIIKSGAVKINGKQISNINYKLSEKDILNNKTIVLENGKYNYGLIHILES